MNNPNPVATYALRLGDNGLVLAQRLGAWCGHAPELEIDLALANIGLDLLGQCGEVIVYAWMDRRRENSEKPYGTRLGAGQAVSARLVGK